MSAASKKILSLGTAIASLTGAQVLGTEAQATPAALDANAAKVGTESSASQLEPNAHYRVGYDLLGCRSTSS
jgi:hypothetical protein